MAKFRHDLLDGRDRVRQHGFGHYADEMSRGTPDHPWPWENEFRVWAEIFLQRYRGFDDWLRRLKIERRRELRANRMWSPAARDLLRIQRAMEAERVALSAAEDVPVGLRLGCDGMPLQCHVSQEMDKPKLVRWSLSWMSDRSVQRAEGSASRGAWWVQWVCRDGQRGRLSPHCPTTAAVVAHLQKAD